MTGAARSDIGKALPVIERLEAAGLKPEALFADGGYPSVPSAAKVIERGIEFVTPVNRSRLSDDIVGRDLFSFDSEGLVTRCPMGNSPIDHRILSGNNSTRRSLHAIFDGNACRSCTMLDRCPVRAPNHRNKGCQARETVGDFRLEITAELRLRDQMYAIQQTTEWKDRYKIRAGIEATNSELKRVSRNRQTSGASAGKSMLCRCMQTDRLQHKEVGQGPLGLEKDPGRLHIVSLY